MAILTTQEGGLVISQRVVAVTVFYWPQLKEGDPDVSYDVMLASTGPDVVFGRYPTLQQAQTVRDAAAAAINANQDYVAP